MKTLISYGNCQAEALNAIFQRDPVAESRYRMYYVPSYDHPSEGMGQLDDELVAECAVLFEQHDPRPFPYLDKLPPTATRVKFPSIDCNLFWPFNALNPYDHPEPPEHPFGRFPYGDRIIIDAIDKGLGVEEILEYYFTRWNEFGVDLTRFYSLETARILARDKRCDVKMADYVTSSWREQRLFWTSNHPTCELLRELIHRLLAVVGDAEPLGELDLDATISYRFAPEGPLGVISVPIHPAIVKHFGLEWYAPDEIHQSFGGVRYSDAEYFESLVRHSIAVKEAAAARVTSG